MASIIDGKSSAQAFRAQIRERVQRYKSETGITPKLVVVLASDDPASAVYVRNKGRAAVDVGLEHETLQLDPQSSPETLLKLIDRLNQDDSVDGILVQLPLPEQHQVNAVIERIDPAKDVDGLHPQNAGKLARGDESVLMPCTPRGCMHLIASTGFALSGKDAVVIGRSRLVGKPVADMLTNQNATVSLCHSKTPDIPERVAKADVVIAAVGRPRFVKAAWLKPGAVVIDVGINRGDDGKLVGDVEWPSDAFTEGFITPVPGGVGPMTIAYLLDNTLIAAQRRRPQ